MDVTSPSWVDVDELDNEVHEASYSETLSPTSLQSDLAASQTTPGAAMKVVDEGDEAPDDYGIPPSGQITNAGGQRASMGA